MRACLTALLTALAAGVAPAAAAVESITVQVDGLTCPFCAFGLEKQLKKLAGVDDVRIEVDAGRADLRLADTVRVADPKAPGGGLLAAVRRAVESGGFTPRELRLTASGRLETKGEATELVVAGTGERIAVDARALDPAPAAGPVRVDGVVREVESQAVLEIQQLLDAEPAGGGGPGS